MYGQAENYLAAILFRVPQAIWCALWSDVFLLPAPFTFSLAFPDLSVNLSHINREDL